MKTTPLDAHRAAFCSYIGGPMNLALRRTIATRPLRRHSRLLDQSALSRAARECEGIATVEYYGHPSRRLAIAYPLRGIDGLDAVRKAIRAAGAEGLCVSCGNYIFKLSY